MSVLEEVRDLESRITGRLLELQPLVEEYDELKRVAERLGIDTSMRPPKISTLRRGKDPRSTPGGTQAAGRRRREAVAALVRERPGMTVPQIAAELKVDATSLYRVVRRLEADGTLTKDGMQLHPR